ncbi:MAG: hypothetical protein U0790_27320 [Isosphaeraceae bacterium]
MCNPPATDEVPSQLDGIHVPFLGWSRAAHEFRRLAARLAPTGSFRPLIIGESGVGKRTMACVWRRVSGQSPEERPIIDLDTWGDAVPFECIAVTARRPPPGRDCWRLDEGAWGEAGGRGDLPAELMQRFSIPIYMPPLHGCRQIDALAYLDFCTRARFPRHRIEYRRIAADLIEGILFGSDWPANLAGLARSLRNLSYADGGRLSPADHRGGSDPPGDTLRDRWPELRWFGSRGVGSDNSGLVAWACGGEEVAAESVPDVAVRLYTRLAQSRVAEHSGREAEGMHRSPGTPKVSTDLPPPDLTAREFLELSEEQFARRYLIAHDPAGVEGGHRELESALGWLRKTRILGTDFTALQAGLRIYPVRADLPSYRAIAVNQVRSRMRNPEIDLPADRAPSQVPISPAEADEFRLEQGIFHIVYHSPSADTEKESYPRDKGLGLAYYRYLLQHPGRKFSPTALEQAVANKGLAARGDIDRSEWEAMSSGPAYDAILDDQARREIATRLEEIAGEITRAERRGDLSKVDRLRQESTKLHAGLNQTVRNPHEARLAELHEGLKEVYRDLEEAREDGNAVEIGELEEQRQSLVDELARIMKGARDKALDMSAKKARDRVRKAMGQACKSFMLGKLPGLALHLRGAVVFKHGRWSYHPPEGSLPWRT